MFPWSGTMLQKNYYASEQKLTLQSTYWGDLQKNIIDIV
jgi:hypothetical protein